MMWALAIASCLCVAAAIVHYRARVRHQAVAEAIVDALYSAAAIMYSIAAAADAALVEYRRSRARIRDEHVAQYVEVL